MRVLATGMLLALSFVPSGRLTVSHTDLLTDGAQIAVSGAGFMPHSELLVGQCGPNGSCNDQGGVQPVTTDATGSFGPVPLLLALRFGDVDCSIAACAIVARAQSGGPDPVTVPISFAGPTGGTPAPGSGARPGTGGQATPTSPGSTLPWAPLAILALLLLAALGLVLTARSRRRPAPAPATPHTGSRMVMAPRATTTIQDPGDHEADRPRTRAGSDPQPLSG